MSFDSVLLGDVCEITMGQAPSGDTYNTEGEGLPLIAGAGDFGVLSPEATKFTNAPTKVSRQGDVILCIRATIGDRNWSDIEYCLGRGVAGLAGRPKRLDQKYLWHWLGHVAPVLKSRGRGAIFLQVNKADIASLEIPLPPLAEQRRIAAILDKADALRAKRREAIAKLDQLLQSVFLDMFGDSVPNPKGWPLREFSQAADFITGHPFKSAGFLPPGEGIKLCRGTNVLPSTLDWTEEANWTSADAGSLERYRIVPGDVVVAMDRPWISTGFKIHLFSDGDPDCLLVQRVARLRPRAHFTSNFLYALFASDAFKRHCKPTETTVPHISPNDFRTFPILDPGKASIDRYERIATLVRSQAKRLSLSLCMAENLFGSVQHKTFARVI